MRNFKIKHLLLLSSAVGAGLSGGLTGLYSPARASCTSYAPTSGMTVTCSGSANSGISANSSTSNITVVVEDGATLTTSSSAISLSGSGNTINLRGDSAISSSSGTAITLGSNSTSGNHLLLSGGSSISAGFYSVFLQGSLGSIVLNDNSQITSSGNSSAVGINGNSNSIILYDTSLIQTTGTTNANGIVVFGSGNTIVIDSGSSIDANGSAIRLSAASNTIFNHGTLIGDVRAINGSSLSDTVSNYGALIGNSGIALSLSSGNDSLTLGTGSSISGTIDGGSGTDDLTLVGIGSEDSNFTNFETLAVNGSDWTLSGTNSFTTVTLYSGSFTNAGSLTATGGVTLSVAAGVSLSNSGTMTANVNGSSGDDTVYNYGTINGSITLNDGNDALILGTYSSITGSIDGGGGADELTLVGSSNEDSPFTNFELLTMDGIDWSLSGTSSFDQIAVNSGMLRVNGDIAGDMTVASGGTLAGTGTLVGDVVSTGTIAPGNSVGTLTVNGSFTQTGGSFEVEFDETGNADLLWTTGAVTLDGPTLIVTALNDATSVHDVIVHSDSSIMRSWAA